MSVRNGVYDNFVSVVHELEDRWIHDEYEKARELIEWLGKCIALSMLQSDKRFLTTILLNELTVTNVARLYDLVTTRANEIWVNA